MNVLTKWESVSNEIINLDFGPDCKYSCLSNSIGKEGGGRWGGDGGGGAAGSCFSSLSPSSIGLTAGGDGVAVMTGKEGSAQVVLLGEINFITRGTNSLGEPYIFGSTNLDEEICDFSPDATGLNLIVECKMASNYPLKRTLLLLRWRRLVRTMCKKHSCSPSSQLQHYVFTLHHSWYSYCHPLVVVSPRPSLHSFPKIPTTIHPSISDSRHPHNRHP